MKKILLFLFLWAGLVASARVIYPTTRATFYGESIDLSRNYNICVGRTDGGVEVHMIQWIKPIANRSNEYVVVRQWRYADGTFIKQSISTLGK